MDTFTDPIDGNIYKIVKIGNLYWFAENLRYKGIEHCFPNRDSDNVSRYGCLYTWVSAKFACPEGWRLPTKDEFKQLLMATNVHDNTSALRDSSWKNGSDSSGFGAMSAGTYRSGHYNYFGYNSGWWSASEYSSSCAHYLFLDDDLAFVSYTGKTSGLSVRCVKDVA